jgi:hypothetical protein
MHKSQIFSLDGADITIKDTIIETKDEANHPRLFLST